MHVVWPSLVHHTFSTMTALIVQHLYLSANVSCLLCKTVNLYSRGYFSTPYRIIAASRFPVRSVFSKKSRVFFENTWISFKIRYILAFLGWVFLKPWVIFEILSYFELFSAWVFLVGVEKKNPALVRNLFRILIHQSQELAGWVV